MNRNWLCAMVCAASFSIGCGDKKTMSEGELERNELGQIVVGDLYLAPESENRERTTVLPSKASEDVRSLLGNIEALSGVQGTERVEGERDYLPEPAVSWIVDVRLEGDPALDPWKITNAFGEEWREQFGGFSDYGRDVDTGRWTFLISRDGPKAVDQLKFAFDYKDEYEKAPTAREKAFEQRLEQITEKMKSFGKPTVTASATPLQASLRVGLLQGIKETMDQNVVLVLNAPRGQKFEGIKIWDVMLCLGLVWGDMDCFHFENDSGVGDSCFFSVETSTSPGYFLPEEIADGKVQVEDLIFVYSVPRSANPVAVFDAMLKAAEYCQKRLGGAIVDEAGKAIDSDVLRRKIEENVEKLRSAGFEPGHGATLQLF
jgi:cell division protein ZipA